MPSSGGQRLIHSKKALCCNVTFLDDSVATYEVPKDAKGSILFQSVVRSLELDAENKYFGLLYLDSQSYPMWLDFDKKIKSQMKVDPPFKFQFRVKYYVLEPGAMLSEEITRYQFVLQLKKDLFQQRLSCTFRTLALLASFVVQSELGDYDPSVHKARYLKEFKFIPNQPADLETEIAELHALHSGLTPEEVELKYLEKAKWLNGYGVDARSVKDVHGLTLKLGISPAGIQVLQGSNVREVFDWFNITKLRFHQKKFYVKVNAKQPGVSEQEHCFLVDKTKHCKILWKVCLEHHGFYKSLPPVDRTAPLLRSVSQRVPKNDSNPRPTIQSDSSRDRTPRARDVTRDVTRDVPRDMTHSQPTTPHRTPRARDRPDPREMSHDRTDISRDRLEMPRDKIDPSRDLSRDRGLQHRSRERIGPDYRAQSGGRTDYSGRNTNFSNSLPRNRPDNTLPRSRPDHSLPRSNKPDHTRQDGSYYEKNSGNHGNGSLAKRSQSFGATDVLDLDYLQRNGDKDYTGNYGNHGNRSNYGNYGGGYKSTGALLAHGHDNGKTYRDDGIRSFFTDNVLQSKQGGAPHDSVNMWRSGHVTQRPRNGSKSTPDVRVAASQPAFMTSSAARQANFLMTTEL